MFIDFASFFQVRPLKPRLGSLRCHKKIKKAVLGAAVRPIIGDYDDFGVLTFRFKIGA
jgi:hypothetical protein